MFEALDEKYKNEKRLVNTWTKIIYLKNRYTVNIASL